MKIIKSEKLSYDELKDHKLFITLDELIKNQS